MSKAVKIWPGMYGSAKEEKPEAKDIDLDIVFLILVFCSFLLFNAYYWIRLWIKQ